MKLFTYLLLGCFALLGNARLFLFALNRVVFGQRHEGDRMKWVFYSVPPLLAGMGWLYYELHTALESGSIDPPAMFGAVWLGVTTGAGVWWMVDKGWQRLHPERIERIRELPSEVIRLRKAHIPFLWLRSLGAHNDIYDLEVTDHQVIVPDLPAAFDGYRIAFVSDTHVASFMRRGFYREVLHQIRRAQTDLVLMGGDFVSFRKDIPLMAR
ncbi:MAG TPA: hypothetical protein VM534_01075, partial [Thermoanaerobaculia bacterium]|nr:hypothetical protein [Thermoanaerobaculia bacterium]